MYQVKFDPEAIKFLESIDKKLAQRIWKKIMSTKPNPHRFFERLVGRKDFKLRIGDYRAIADIYDKEKIIEVTLIDNRGRIYKRI